MQPLPLVDLFPISTRPQTLRDEVLRTLAGLPPESPVLYADALALALTVAGQFPTSTASNAAAQALLANAAYATWQQAMPALTEVPALAQYRNGPAAKRNLSAMAAEIQAFGGLLTSGQVLYRGTRWPTGATPKPGEAVDNPALISTAILPGPADVHARKHVPLAALLVLTVEPHCVLPAFAFRNRRNEKYEHEAEVILGVETVMTCVAVHTAPHYTVVECSIQS
jgi:hypothetical protein